MGGLGGDENEKMPFLVGGNGWWCGGLPGRAGLLGW